MIPAAVSQYLTTHAAWWHSLLVNMLVRLSQRGKCKPSRHTANQPGQLSLLPSTGW